MNRYFKYIISVLSLSCIVSCVQNDEIATPNGGGQMSLRLVSNTMTRAKGDTDNNRNEDKLVSADLYFYASRGAAGSENAKWHTRIEMENTSEEYTDENLTLPANVMQSVFGSGDSGYLYVIANYPSGAVALPTYASGSDEIANSSINELKKYEVTAQWGPTDTDTDDDCVQSSFVMDGESSISKSGSSVTGSILLTRAAAKIELNITGFTGVPAEGVVDGEGNRWLPNFTDDNATSIGAYVMLQNAVANSYVGAPMAAGSYSYDATTATDGFYGYGTKATDGSYSQLIPFYSYSSDWSASGGANPASLLLVVPWKKVGTTEVQNCYYEIPIGSRDNNLIERNKHYKIGVNVGTLGSFAPSTNVTITPAYITVVDWSTGQIDVNIAEARYLVVDQNEIDVFNQTDGYVNFASSHPTTIEIISVTRPNFSGKVAGTYTYTPSENNKTTVTPTNGNTNSFTLTKDGDNVLKLSHVLVNDNASASFDYAVYTIQVKIYHTDNTSFSETITFKQYPAMYVEAYLNSDYKDDNNENNDNANKGYVWLNGSQNGGQNASLGGVNGLGSATNANPNMYVITTTVLSNRSNYIIADPRAVVYDNTLGSNSTTWSNSARALYPAGGSNRRLSYYYPTGVTSTTTEQIIAPKFRVASSYGVTYQGSYDEMRRRCASYQEDGYPAGRWRMPTAAEVKYIVTLSAKGIIPLLFNNGDEYACAEGYIVANNGNVNFTATKLTSGVAVRCVYDDWYWGSERALKTDTEKDVFTWGDQPR